MFPTKRKPGRVFWGAGCFECVAAGGEGVGGGLCLFACFDPALCQAMAVCHHRHNLFYFADQHICTVDFYLHQDESPHRDLPVAIVSRGLGCEGF